MNPWGFRGWGSKFQNPVIEEVGGAPTVYATNLGKWVVLRIAIISEIEHIDLYFFNNTEPVRFFDRGAWRTVEIELEIEKCSQSARWKDDTPIFQNLQKIQIFVE